MGRVINPNSPGKHRNQLVRGVVIALQELLSREETGEEARDLAAYIALSLGEIAATIEKTVEPWEKRGYWLKADRFRLDWDWADRLGKSLSEGLLGDDWDAAAQAAAQIMGKVHNVQVPIRHRLGTPWVGAWTRLQEKTEVT